MTSMKDKMKRAAAYKSSRVKREEELRAAEAAQTPQEASPARRKRGKDDKITLAMDSDLRRSLKTYCVTHGITMSDLVESLIRQVLQEEEGK